MKFQLGDVVKPLPNNPYLRTTGNTRWFVIEEGYPKMSVIEAPKNTPNLLVYLQEALKLQKNKSTKKRVYPVEPKYFDLVRRDSLSNKKSKFLLSGTEESLSKGSKLKSESMWNMDDQIPF